MPTETTKKKRKSIDWSKGDKLIRAGVLSNREIARQLGCTDTAVRRRIQNHNIQRDLSDDIRKATKAKLVRSESSQESQEGCTIGSQSQATDNEIIEEAATLQAKVVIGHREDIKRLRALELQLIEEVFNPEEPPTKVHVSSYQGKVAQTVLQITATERAAAAGNLANVQAKRIMLERQAFGITDDDGDLGDNPKEGKWLFEAIAVKKGD